MDTAHRRARERAGAGRRHHTSRPPTHLLLPPLVAAPVAAAFRSINSFSRWTDGQLRAELLAETRRSAALEVEILVMHQTTRGPLG